MAIHRGGSMKTNEEILKEVYSRMYIKIEGQTDEQLQDLGWDWISKNPVEKERVEKSLAIQKDEFLNLIDEHIEKRYDRYAYGKDPKIREKIRKNVPAIRVLEELKKALIGEEKR
jgi:hypothetical protein